MARFEFKYNAGPKPGQPGGAPPKGGGCLPLLLRWMVSAVAIYFAAWLLPGIEIQDFKSAMWVSLILGLINIFLKPLLMLISLPLIVFTLGLFLLVINAVVLYFASDMVSSFQVDGFWSAFWGSIVITLVTYLLNPPRRKPQRPAHDEHSPGDYG